MVTLSKFLAIAFLKTLCYPGTCVWRHFALDFSQHGDPAADQIVLGPSGGCRGDPISTPDSAYYQVFYESFLWGNLCFGGCFEKPRLQALFGAKSFVLGKKNGKVTKRRRSVKQIYANGGTNRANGGTNRANGGTNASFCTSGGFTFFGTWPHLHWLRQCDGETWKIIKKEGRERLWPKAEKRFL